MNPHSYFSNCQEKDLVRFDKNRILEISQLKLSIKKIFSDFIETPFTNFLDSSGIKTFKATHITYPNGEKKIHYNQWFNQGIVCEVLHLGSQTWQKGRIKIRVHVEFYPDTEELVAPLATNMERLYSQTTKAITSEEPDEELKLLEQKIWEKH